VAISPKKTSGPVTSGLPVIHPKSTCSGGCSRPSRSGIGVNQLDKLTASLDRFDTQG
jgi:hypothetical protein